MKGSFRFAVVLAVALAAVAVLVAVTYRLPLRDPDEVAGPSYVRLPLILALAFLTDVVPRMVWRARSARDLPATFAAVTRQRWPWEHVRFALVGLSAWYLTYVAFRNLKSLVPFVNPHLWDAELSRIDRLLFLGHDPAVVLHHALGLSWAAHLLSFVYIAWIVLVPATLVMALVWSRDVTGGAWYVTAVAVDWVLGVALYFAFPTVGPVYVRPEQFAGLAHTDVTTIQATMWADRLDVLQNPFGTEAVQTIAAFASLHVGITVTICIIATLLGLPRAIRWGLWIFLALTVLATIYLGWHYLTDDLVGALLGAAAVWLGAVATGNHQRGRPMRKQPLRRDEIPVR